MCADTDGYFCGRCWVEHRQIEIREIQRLLEAINLSPWARTLLLLEIEEKKKLMEREVCEGAD